MSYMKRLLEEEQDIKLWADTYQETDYRPGYMEATCYGWRFVVTWQELSNGDIGVTMWSPTQHQLICSPGQYINRQWLATKIGESPERAYIYSMMIAAAVKGSYSELAA